MKDEKRLQQFLDSSFIFHPSSFILHPFGQSGEWGSNPPSPASKAGGLPLSYPLSSTSLGRKLRERELNPPRRAYETLLEPLQSIPQVAATPDWPART